MTNYRQHIAYRLLRGNGTPADVEDIIGKYYPIAVLKLEEKSKYCLLIFYDPTSLRRRNWFAQVRINDFNRVIDERNQRRTWMKKFGGGMYDLRVRYIGEQTFIPDWQKKITFEFYNSNTMRLWNHIVLSEG